MSNNTNTQNLKMFLAEIDAKIKAGTAEDQVNLLARNETPGLGDMIKFDLGFCGCNAELTARAYYLFDRDEILLGWGTNGDDIVLCDEYRYMFTEGEDGYDAEVTAFARHALDLAMLALPGYGNWDYYTELIGIEG